MKNKPVSHYLKEKICLSQMLLRVIYSNGSMKKIEKLRMAMTMRYLVFLTLPYIMSPLIKYVKSYDV